MGFNSAFKGLREADMQVRQDRPEHGGRMLSEALVHIYMSTRHNNIPDNLNLIRLSSMTYQSCISNSFRV